MAIARISRLELVGTQSAAKRARVSRLTFDGTALAGEAKRARISRLSLTGAYDTKRARVSNLRLTGSNQQPMVPSLFATPATSEPGATITVSAAGTTGSGVVTSWEIISGGSGVALTGSGQTYTMTAPRDYQGRTIVVQVSYLDSFGATDTRTVSVTVRPQQWWFCTPGGTMIPVTYPFLRI